MNTTDNSPEEQLRVVVCVKQVLDPEAPPSLLEVDPATNRVTGRGVAPRLDPYSLHALHAALRIRSDLADRIPVDITAVGVGPSPSRNLYLKVLAAGADRVTLLDTPRDAIAFGDSWAAARLLSRLIGVAVPEGWDLLLTGRRAADTNAAAVGPALAHLLATPVITLATAIGVEHRSGSPASLLVDRLTDSGTEVVGCELPAVVTVSHEVGELEAVPFSRLVEAKGLPLEVISEADLGGDRGSGPWSAPTVEGMHLRDESRRCELVTGEDARDAGRALARRLLATFPTAG